MENSNKEEDRESGLDIVGKVPWGTHFCQFYQTKKDLSDILVPYFYAGIKNNEYCVWVTSDFFTKEEAIKAMETRLPSFLKYLKNGQIEIFPYTQWYLKEGKFELERVLKMWLAKHNKGINSGYSGLRVSGNPFWIDNKKDWDDFASYEAKINNVISSYKLLVLCTYSLEKCHSNEIIDVVTNHQFAIIKRSGDWQLIESAQQKKIKQALQQSGEQLRNSLAMIGHELNNFLTPLTLSIDLLEKKMTGQSGVDLSLSMIKKQTGKITWLVKDLLDVFSVEKGKMELNKKRVNICSIVKNAAETARPLIEKAGQKLKVVLPNELIIIRADSLRVEQIITNLLSNASKYSKKNGLIRLRVEKNGKFIYIKVKDNGIGISKDFIPNIFGLFTQADQLSGQKRKGLGIGLYLSQQLARLHGGDISVLSKGTGKGSEFILKIPLK